MEDGNRAQAELWNGAAGRSWVAAEASLDIMYRPLADLLVDRLGGARHVLDIGCGGGRVTLDAAKRLGAATGIDISEPLIALARGRAAMEGSNAEFLCGDAQGYGFTPGQFDLLISRFGISFFADPVRAFANLRRAVKPGGALCFLTWREPKENPFMTEGERAAAPLLPPPPPQVPHAPGPFALADRRRIATLLEESGWRDIAVTPVDRICAFPERDLMHYLAWMGPVGRLLQTAEENTRARVLETVRSAFDVFVTGDEVRFDAACWMIEARA
ncbi:MAG TPA: class I SAM-dependent methyltransferase [Rhizomicrobium sp.]